MRSYSKVSLSAITAAAMGTGTFLIVVGLGALGAATLRAAGLPE